MNKDNLLFAVFGILVGFIAGYLMHEVMAMRQPPRQLAGAGAPAMPQAPQAMPQNTGGAGAPPADGGAGPAMQEIQELSQRVQNNPNDAEAVLRLANLNFEINRWQRARELYEQYLKLKPESPDVLSDLGVTYREQGQYDQALELFHRAQSLDPNHWRSLYNEVVVLAFDQRRLNDADRVLQRLRQMQPGNADVERLAAEVERSRNTPS